MIRGNDLHKDVSSYLVQRIEQTPNIELLRNTEVRRMSGDRYLTSIEVVNNKTGEVRTLETAARFSFIGAVPWTEWLPPEIERDAKGFVRTGPAVSRSPYWTPGGSRFFWKPATPACLPQETCGPARSSASPSPSTRVRWRSSSYTST